MGVSVQLCGPAARGRKPQYLLYRSWVVQSRSGRDGEKKKKCLPCPCPESSSGRPTRSLVTELTELSQNSGNACYHSVQKLASPRPTSRHPKFRIYTRAIWKVRGPTSLLQVGTLWRCGDSLFFEIPTFASHALLTTLHPLLEKVLQTVDYFEIFRLGAPFSSLEKPKNRMGLGKSGSMEPH
jgi:hypothetical protein